MSPKPILLVEDDDDHAVLFMHLLEDPRLGRPVIRASSLAEALQLQTEHTPWAVVLDLSLPDSSGVDTLLAVEGSAPNQAVVVLSANAEEALSVEAIRNGAQDYLVKERVSGELLVRSLLYGVERKRALRALERKNREVEAFASLASHDLRSPLRRIRQAVEVLGDEIVQPSEEAAYFLEVLRGDADRLQHLVGDMLRFARVGVEGLQLSTFALEDAVGGALRLLAAPIAASRATVRTAGLPEVTADRGLVEILVQNLVGNAIHYVDGRPPEVLVRAEEQEGFTVVHVCDNGIGVPADQLERIFDPLVRAVRYEDYKGTGLGLAMCRKIVEAHGGEIWAESQPGRGSTFSFTLARRSPETVSRGTSPCAAPASRRCEARS